MYRDLPGRLAQWDLLDLQDRWELLARLVQAGHKDPAASLDQLVQSDLRGLKGATVFPSSPLSDSILSTVQRKLTLLANLVSIFSLVSPSAL